MGHGSASMLKNRLLSRGLDERLWNSQFGFRKKQCTEDAIFVAKRHIELALAQRHGCLSLLALDWAKAFDSVNVENLWEALKRYGISEKIANLLENLLHHRQFFVEDSGVQSSVRSQ